MAQRYKNLKSKLIIFLLYLALQVHKVHKDQRVSQESLVQKVTQENVESVVFLEKTVKMENHISQFMNKMLAGQYILMVSKDR